MTAQSMNVSSAFQGLQLEKADVRPDLSDIHLTARQETMFLLTLESKHLDCYTEDL